MHAISMPSPSISNVLETAQRYHYRDSLGPKAYEQAKNISSELINYRAKCADLFLILGSFEEGDRERVETVRDIIGGNQDCEAVMMDEFSDVPAPRDGLAGHEKFCLLCEYVDHIVGVCEHARGGFLIEQAIIVLIDEIGEKSHILKRLYSDDTEHEKYSWMQSSGVFLPFVRRGNLYEWETEDELKRQTHTLAKRVRP